MSVNLLRVRSMIRIRTSDDFKSFKYASSDVRPSAYAIMINPMRSMIVCAAFMTAPMVIACIGLMDHGLAPNDAIMSVALATWYMPWGMRWGHVECVRWSIIDLIILLLVSLVYSRRRRSSGRTVLI